MGQNVIDKINFEYKSLSKTHRVIADLYLNNAITKSDTLLDVSRLGYCSHSTVLRFIRILGYDSFKVFSNDYFNTISYDQVSISKSFEIVDNFIISNSDIINSFIDQILGARNIYLFASGMSYLPAYNLAYKCNMLENRFILVDEVCDITQITNKDLVIFISNSGNSRKLKVLSHSIDDFYLISNFDNTALSKLATTTFCLNNHVESHHMMDTQPRESIYSLTYFTDYLFDLLKQKL